MSLTLPQTVQTQPLAQIRYFARDGRVFGAFAERLDTHRELVERCCGRRLRAQLVLLREGFDGRAITHRMRLLTSLSLAVDSVCMIGKIRSGGSTVEAGGMILLQFCAGATPF